MDTSSPLSRPVQYTQNSPALSIDYLYSAHQGVLVSTLACPKDPGDFSWLWLGIIVPLALFYCIIPLTSAWATPLKRHIFRRNRLYWIGKVVLQYEIECNHQFFNLQPISPSIYEKGHSTLTDDPKTRAVLKTLPTMT